MRPDPRRQALLDDACWLIYRLFGVAARPHLAGLAAPDRVWDVQFPWVCQYIHSGEAFAPLGAPPTARLRATRSCPLARARGGDGRGLPAAGRCAAGLRFAALRADAGGGYRGAVVLGPWTPGRPRAAGFRRLARELEIPEWEHMRWAHAQSPVLPPARERALLGFTRALLDRLRDAAMPPPPPAAANDPLEHAYPPLRLADDLPLRIHGVFVTAASLTAAPAIPPPLEVCDLEYVDRGRCRVTTGGRAFPLTEGQAVLSLPGDRPRFEPEPGNPATEGVSIAFVANASRLAHLARRPLGLDAFQSALLSQLVRLATPDHDGAHRDSRIKLLLANLLLSWPDRREGGIPPAARPAWTGAREAVAADRLRRAIEAAAEERLRIGDLAARFGISMAVARRTLRSALGMTPKRYHEELRVRRARLLLRHSLLTVTQVAAKLGYHSVHHFSRAFRRRTALTPTAYARSVRAGLRPIETAQELLRQGPAPAGELARRLGFPSPQFFAKRFKGLVGTTPREFRRQVAARRPGPGR